MKILAISLLLLITGCSYNYEPLPQLNATMCTVVRVWGGEHEPDSIDILYFNKVYQVNGPFPYRTFKSGDTIIVLLPIKK